MNELIIKNATLVDNISITNNAHMYIKDGIISLITLNITDIENYKDIKTVDAKGLILMPGGIDVHTHLDLDLGSIKASDSFETGTIAAACGGTTTIVDHIGFGEAGCTIKSIIDKYHLLATDNAVIDYGFHGVLQHIDENILNEMYYLFKEGITSMKLYMVYAYKFDDDSVIKALNKMRELGGIICAHAENNASIEYLKDFYAKKGKLSAVYHAKSRPDITEAESVNRLICLANVSSNAPIYIVHLSTKKGLDIIEKYIKEGSQVYAETCPQYLLLNETYYDKPNNEGLKYMMAPPLREKYNNDALWNGLKTSSISTVGTDHCPFNFKDKLNLGIHDFRDCPCGFPGIESRMALMFSEGVSKKRITLNKFVEITSTNPAKLFGLYPKKGSISVGSDADFVLFDANKKQTITHKALHENVDYAGYEGFEVMGLPVMTISRGEIIACNNEYVGKKGRGKFLKRGPSIYLR